MPTADDVLAIAASDLGVVESPPNSNRTKFGRWYGLDGQPYCAMAVSYWFSLAGLPLPASTAKGFAYTPSGAAWFQRQGRWTTRPQRGHVVFFDFPGDGVSRISHVGIVESVRADGSVVTIEANTSPGDGGSQRDGGGVFRRVRRSGIVGYGVPAYSEPIQPPAEPGEEEDDMKVAVVLWAKDSDKSYVWTGERGPAALAPIVEDGRSFGGFTKAFGVVETSEAQLDELRKPA